MDSTDSPGQTTSVTVHVKITCVMIYLSTAIGLTPGGSGTVHIYTQTVHRTTQLTTKQYE
jgi:uncharacterized integral membrane protein